APAAYRPNLELRAGLAHRRRGDDAAGLADLDLPAGRQTAAVAPRAHAAARRAGQDRPNLHLLDAGVLNRGGEVLGDLVVDLDDGLGGERVGDLLERHAADDAVAERLDDLA